MKRLGAVWLSVLIAAAAAAHPGSGIVADKEGRVYFVDTGAGVWKLESGGSLTRAPGPAFHWMAIDPDNRFAKTPLPSGSGWELARAGSSPTILLSSDFPVTIGKDGSLYYSASVASAAVEIRKLTPAGASSVLAKLPVGWVNGLASGPGGSIYFTEDRAIRKIDRAGRVTTVVSGVTVAGCASISGDGAGNGPCLRGLDVGADGSIVVAASGCGTVLEIAPDGKVKTRLQLAPPWSPTAVVHVGKDVHVLEYLHTAGDDRRVWIPRVRRLSADGKSAVVATVERP